MMYNYMDCKHTMISSFYFLGSPGACTRNVLQALSPPQRACVCVCVCACVYIHVNYHLLNYGQEILKFVSLSRSAFVSLLDQPVHF